MTIKVRGPLKRILLFFSFFSKDAKFPADELSHGSESKGEREEEQKQLADLDRILAKAKEARTVRLTEVK